MPSGLSDAERTTLLALALAAVAHVQHIPVTLAANQLDRQAARGRVTLEGDDQVVTLTIAGRPIVVVDRAVLRAATAATSA